MSVQRLSHIGICVSELERSVAFYRDVLGFEETSRLQVSGEESARLLQLDGGAVHAVYLQRDGTCIELLYYPRAGHVGAQQPRPMNALGFTHLSLRVADIDAVVAAIESAGGACLADTRVDNPAWRSSAVFVTDPDGVRIELLQTLADPAATGG